MRTIRKNNRTIPTNSVRKENNNDDEGYNIERRKDSNHEEEEDDEEEKVQPSLRPNHCRLAGTNTTNCWQSPSPLTAKKTTEREPKRLTMNETHNVGHSAVVSEQQQPKTKRRRRVAPLRCCWNSAHQASHHRRRFIVGFFTYASLLISFLVPSFWYGSFGGLMLGNPFFFQPQQQQHLLLLLLVSSNGLGIRMVDAAVVRKHAELEENDEPLQIFSQIDDHGEDDDDEEDESVNRKVENHHQQQQQQKDETIQFEEEAEDDIDLDAESTVDDAGHDDGDGEAMDDEMMNHQKEQDHFDPETVLDTDNSRDFHNDKNNDNSNDEPVVEDANSLFLDDLVEQLQQEQQHQANNSYNDNDTSIVFEKGEESNNESLVSLDLPNFTETQRLHPSSDEMRKNTHAEGNAIDVDDHSNDSLDDDDDESEKTFLANQTSETDSHAADMPHQPDETPTDSTWPNDTTSHVTSTTAADTDTTISSPITEKVVERDESNSVLVDDNEQEDQDTLHLPLDEPATSDHDLDEPPSTATITIAQEDDSSSRSERTIAEENRTDDTSQQKEEEEDTVPHTNEPSTTTISSDTVTDEPSSNVTVPSSLPVQVGHDAVTKSEDRNETTITTTTTTLANVSSSSSSQETKSKELQEDAKEDMSDEETTESHFYACTIWGQKRPAVDPANLTLLSLVLEDFLLQSTIDDAKASATGTETESKYSKNENRQGDKNNSDQPTVSNPTHHARLGASVDDMEGAAPAGAKTDNQETKEPPKVPTEESERMAKVRSANSEFVEGLDDIDKFFEDVDPPDELDIGAGGTSIQEVLMGRGSQIVRKRILMGLRKARDVSVAKSKKWWQITRDHLRQMMRKPQKQDFQRAVDWTWTKSRNWFHWAKDKVRQIMTDNDDDVLGDIGWQQPEDNQEEDHDEAIRRLVDRTLR